jgi:hypothetical protein
MHDHVRQLRTYRRMRLCATSANKQSCITLKGDDGKAEDDKEDGSP